MPSTEPEGWKERFRDQFLALTFYRDFCRRRGVTPDNVRSHADVPALPVTAFRRHRVASFPPDRAAAKFTTSGTTGDEWGVHELETLSHYENSILGSFAALTPLVSEKFAFVSLISPAAEAPHSSLAHMVEVLSREHGSGRTHFGLRGGHVDSEGTVEALEMLSTGTTPVFITATTAALWDLLRHLAERKIRLCLPARSRLFETGGRKGRRFVPESRILADLALWHLGIERELFLGEYGMTELSSPAWGRLMGGRMVFQTPPWCPWRAVDLPTGREIAIGECGVLVLFDTMNVGSISALCTGDFVERCEGGFVVLGRTAETESRGCSLAVAPMEQQPPVQAAPPRMPGKKEVALNRTIEVLGLLTERLSDPLTRERRQLEDLCGADPVFSKGSVREGLDMTFRALRRDHLIDAAARAWPEGRPSGALRSAHISGGNLPVTGFFGFYAALLSGSRAIHRPSGRNAAIMSLIHDTLRSMDEDLAGLAAVASTPSDDDAATRSLLSNADLVLAQGDALTLDRLRSLAPESARFVAFGPGLSAAVFADRDPVSEVCLESLARDIFIWNQQGCLSPQVVVWLGENAEDFARALVAAADAKATEWGARRHDRSRNAACWHALDHEMGGGSPHDFIQGMHLCALLTDEIEKGAFSTPGLVQIVTAADAEDAQRALRPLSSFLISLAAPLGTIAMEAAERLAASAGVRRVVDVGNLQAPAFDFTHNGLDRLRIFSG